MYVGPLCDFVAFKRIPVFSMFSVETIKRQKNVSPKVRINYVAYLLAILYKGR